LETFHNGGTETAILDRLVNILSTEGTLKVLRNGFKMAGAGGTNFSMVQFKPAFGFNPEIARKYDRNRLRVIRQVHYSVSNQKCIDLVLFVNGIPVGTIELKTDFTQAVEYAKIQYRKDRLPKNSAPAPFTLADGTSIQIPTMFQNGGVQASFQPGYTIVTLPYSGTPATSMIIILPTQDGSITDLLSRLNTILGGADGPVEDEPVDDVSLFLPKFHVDFSSDLVSSLETLGMHSAFTRSADFSGTGIPNLYVSDVIHKAVIDVDEHGTVAAAATGVIMKPLAIRVPRIVRVDHPFICAIREDQTGSLLFLGVINHPSAAQ
jgi:serine protease inhibitor